VDLTGSWIPWGKKYLRPRTPPKGAGEPNSGKKTHIAGGKREADHSSQVCEKEREKRGNAGFQLRGSMGVSIPFRQKIARKRPASQPPVQSSGEARELADCNLLPKLLGGL